MKVIEKGKCFVCGHLIEFLIEDRACLFREATCSYCGASKRNSDMANTIILTFSGKNDSSLVDSLDLFKDLYIYEAAASGKLHEVLRELPSYHCSEYFEGVPPGSVKDYVRCEDIQNLTFPDNFFDLVITQDVLEHVAEPFKAFKEIKRVLKPGGYHVFTVPLYEGHSTAARAVLEGGNIVHLKPAVFHSDPFRESGSFVFTDFGEDIAERLRESLFMPTEIVHYSKWYLPEEITAVDADGEEYKLYKEFNESGKLEMFFKYNSSVLISRKEEIPFTGERYVPEWKGMSLIERLNYENITYEHLHRYALACSHVKGKTVLDIACGEGYGTSLLARQAVKVVGVDMSEETISHARAKYGHQPNIEFLAGLCTDIPCEMGAFDVVVSFETIEHIAEHEKMLNEIKRVLKKDGVLIISSPNKKSYSDDSCFKNEFHVRELYLSDLRDLLSSRFKSVCIMGQRLTFSSHVWPLEGVESVRHIHYCGDGLKIDRSTAPPYEALYFIALCSDASSLDNIASMSSLYTEKTDSLHTFYSKLFHEVAVKDSQLEEKDRQLTEKDSQLTEKDRQLTEKDRQLTEKDSQIQMFLNSWSWKVTAPLRRMRRLLSF